MSKIIRLEFYRFREIMILNFRISHNEYMIINQLKNKIYTCLIYSYFNQY